MNTQTLKPKNFSEYGLHEEVVREKRENGRVKFFDPFDNSFRPEILERKIYCRNDQWMVKCRGNWCLLSGFKLSQEYPRKAIFRADIRNRYN